MPVEPGWTSPGDSPGAEPAPPSTWGPPQPAWGTQAPPAPAPADRPTWGEPTPPAGGPAEARDVAWSGWGGSPAAAKPGVIPLRPLGVGEILDGAITTVRRYPRATLGMAAVVVTISQVVQFFLVRSFAGSLGDAQVGGDEFSGGGTAALALGTMLGFMANVMLTGALTVVMGQAVLGRPIELRDAWRAVRARLWALLGAALVVLLLSGLALVLLVVPFFYAWPALSLTTPALMLERQTVWRSVRRSAALVRGQFWRCLGVVSLAWLIKTFVSATLAIPFAILGGGLAAFDVSPGATDDLGTTYLLMSTLGAIIAGTVVAPFSAGVSALLYVDRRMRAEGLDVTLAATAAAPPPLPAG